MPTNNSMPNVTIVPISRTIHSKLDKIAPYVSALVNSNLTVNRQGGAKPVLDKATIVYYINMLYTQLNKEELSVILNGLGFSNDIFGMVTVLTKNKADGYILDNVYALDSKVTQVLEVFNEDTTASIELGRHAINKASLKLDEDNYEVVIRGNIAYVVIDDTALYVLKNLSLLRMDYIMYENYKGFILKLYGITLDVLTKLNNVTLEHNTNMNASMISALYSYIYLKKLSKD